MRALSSASVRGLRWLSALIATAAGLWCTRGLLDIVNGPGGVTRVAMLPPWWLLVTFVVMLGAVGAAALRTGAEPDVALPLCALGLLAVPYLPWLPDRVPALRAAAGPARYLLWLVVFWLIACRVIGGRWIRPRVFLSPLVIFVVSAIVFGTVAWRLTGTTLFPGGDEPHYLVITQSLLHDGDLKIENNHRGEEYRAYFNGSLKPDYLALGKDGQIYSIHPVGLPVLAMPAFALWGYHAVVAMLVVMAALAAALLWRWAREMTGSVRAATFAWAAAALTAPFLFNSFTVYPEIPAALAVMVRCGPVANRVTLSTPDWEEQLAIEQGEARHVAIPTSVLPDLGVRLAQLEIAVDGGFVPAEVDRAATDRRFLGCWIEPGRTP